MADPVSRETTEARLALQDAVAAWGRHGQLCATCRQAAKRAAWDKLCTEGFVLHDDLRLARANHKEQVRIDARPIPGQLRLL